MSLLTTFLIRVTGFIVDVADLAGVPDSMDAVVAIDVASDESLSVVQINTS